MIAIVKPIFADMVWPALVLEQRLLSAYPITAGLAVECLALRFGGFGFSWRKAALVDLSMNLVSTMAGIVLLPLLGFAWELFPGSFIYPMFRIGTFNPGTCVATFVLAVLATTAVESATVRGSFGSWSIVAAWPFSA